MNLMQMVIQARWVDDSTLINLPNITKSLIDGLSNHFKLPDISLPELMSLNTNDICKFLKSQNLNENQISSFKVFIIFNFLYISIRKSSKIFPKLM